MHTLNKKNAEGTDPAPKRPWSRRVRRWVLEALFFGLLYLGLTQFQTGGLLPVDGPAPTLELTDVEGQRVSLRDYRGKTVLLHFWATWCGVCVRELPMLRDFQLALPENTVLLSVVQDGDDAQLPEFLRAHGVNYPVLLGTPELVRSFKVNAFPTNYFIDPEGIVRGRSVGFTTQLGLKSRIGCAR